MFGTNVDEVILRSIMLRWLNMRGPRYDTVITSETTAKASCVYDKQIEKALLELRELFTDTNLLITYKILTYEKTKDRIVIEFEVPETANRAFIVGMLRLYNKLDKDLPIMGEY